jgi:hypothetical protein
LPHSVPVLGTRSYFGKIRDLLGLGNSL